MEIIPGLNTLCSFPPCVSPLDELGAGAEQILNLSPNTWNYSIKNSQRLRDYSTRAKGLDSDCCGSKFNPVLWDLCQILPVFSQILKDFAKGQTEGGG